MKLIVVATDFSPQAELAMWQAADLARATGARLLLLHIVTMPELALGLEATLADSGLEKESLISAQLASAREQLAGLETAVRERGIQVTSEVRDGFADTAIGDCATALGADLVVIGTHGRTGLKRFLLGSVAERVVRLSTESVLVARAPAGPESARHGFARILVPTDFSDLAEAALTMSLSVATAKARIDIVHAWQIPASVTAYAPARVVDAAFGGLREQLIADIEKRGKCLVSRFSRPEKSVRFFALEGSPAAAILAHLGDRRYDLVVMGAHGRRRMKRLIVGSVVERVIRHAPCSVLAVHRRPRAPEA
ncbi:MAG TPA: universal stress protein [Kofleriaceae bacterium]|nr:universal stress protein [Kofleriaceae bacterium]